MSWLKKLIGKLETGPSKLPAPGPRSKAGVNAAASGAPTAPAEGLRAVPGALVASSGGDVIYNLLDPHMQQFMGRCVGVAKKAGLRAKGSGQFSVRVEDRVEVKLDLFYQRHDDPAVFDDFLAAAKHALAAAPSS